MENTIKQVNYIDTDRMEYITDLVLEHKNDDGTIHYFIIYNVDPRTNKYTVEDFNNAQLLDEHDKAYSLVQDYCKMKYKKTIEELAMPNLPALQKKIEALEKRIARLEEYADAIDMVAELINDIFPE